jgi:hypothetical protein
MGFFFDYTPATTPLQPSNVPKDTATLASAVRDTRISQTLYEYKKAVDLASPSKPYTFKTQEERMKYMLEAMKTSNCIE